MEVKWPDFLRTWQESGGKSTMVGELNSKTLCLPANKHSDGKRPISTWITHEEWLRMVLFHTYFTLPERKQSMEVTCGIINSFVWIDFGLCSCSSRSSEICWILDVHSHLLEIHFSDPPIFVPVQSTFCDFKICSVQALREVCRFSQTWLVPIHDRTAKAKLQIWNPGARAPIRTGFQSYPIHFEPVLTSLW